MVIPIMIMVIFAQRAIVSGLTRGRLSRHGAQKLCEIVKYLLLLPLFLVDCN